MEPSRPTTRADRLGELLLDWEEARERGVDLDASTLCPGDPALAEILRRRIEALGTVDRLIEAVQEFRGRGWPLPRLPAARSTGAGVSARPRGDSTETQVMLGIDFGTSLSCVGRVDGGRVVLAKEPQRHGYSFPTSAYLADDGRLLVGEAAEVLRDDDPTRYAHPLKPELGRPGVGFLLGDRSFTVEALAAAVLGRLRDEARRQLGAGDADAALLTVPVGWTDARVSALERSARAAGFGRVETLHEPVAAALWYEQTTRRPIAEGEAVLVYDLGGGTFDASLLVRKGGALRPPVGPVGEVAVGGREFDRLIFQELRERASPTLRSALEGAEPGDPDSLRLLADVGDECRRLKHLLSETEEAAVWVKVVRPAERFTLSRVRFESLIAPLVEKTVASCLRLAAEAGTALTGPPLVLMAGGSCRIPLIARRLEQAFGRKPELLDDPELAVCRGAAVEAARRVAAARSYRPDYTIRRDIFGLDRARTDS